MSIGYVLCISAVLLVLFLCARSIVRDHRQESGGCGAGCAGCSGSCGSSCAGCNGCANSGDIVITVKRKKYNRETIKHDNDNGEN